MPMAGITARHGYRMRHLTRHPRENVLLFLA
jgi:hypothetical protein